MVTRTVEGKRRLVAAAADLLRRPEREGSKTQAEIRRELFATLRRRKRPAR